MNLDLLFEFTDGRESYTVTFEEMAGVPIPVVGDFVSPVEGEYKILTRTFAYSDDGFQINYRCEPAKL